MSFNSFEISSIASRKDWNRLPYSRIGFEFRQPQCRKSFLETYCLGGPSSLEKVLRSAESCSVVPWREVQLTLNVQPLSTTWAAVFLPNTCRVEFAPAAATSAA